MRHENGFKTMAFTAKIEFTFISNFTPYPEFQKIIRLLIHFNPSSKLSPAIKKIIFNKKMYVSNK
jgi:hypothetical protein